MLKEKDFRSLHKRRYFQNWQVLSIFHASSLLCTITTPFGRFRYLRLPYGISCAPEIFQRFMHELLENIPGQITYFDDILVYGSTISEHNKNLKIVLNNIEKSGLTLNLNKSKFCVRDQIFGPSHK